jgi:diguanylate cyclase (GGDEF)-like protein
MQIRVTRLELKAIALLVAICALVVANGWNLYREDDSSGLDQVASVRMVHLSELVAAASAVPAQAASTQPSDQANALGAVLLRARDALKRLLIDYHYDGATYAKLSAIDDAIVGRLTELRRGNTASGPKTDGDLDIASVTRLSLSLLGDEQQRIESRGQARTEKGSPGAGVVFQALPMVAIAVLGFLIVRDARAWRRRAEKPGAAKFLEPGQTVGDRRALVAGIQASIVSSLNKSRTIGLMYVDLTNLGAIRQELGWESADRIVTDVAELLRGELRRSDLVARLEGDVLVVMASDISARCDIEGIATRIRRVLDKFEIAALPDVRITAEIGSAMYPIDGYSAEDMLTAARNSLNERNTFKGFVVLRATSSPQPA